MLLTAVCALLLAAGCATKEAEEKNEFVCVDRCGDGICQEIVCEAEGCPCAETKETCPGDCGKLECVDTGTECCLGDSCSTTTANCVVGTVPVIKGCDSECRQIVSCEATADEEEQPIGMANPASVYCVEQGGSLDVREDARGYGEYGVCVLANGTECEEWAYFKSDGRDCVLYNETKPNEGFCGNSTMGECKSDKGCTTSGCGGEICQATAEAKVVTACEERECCDPKPYGLSCKCVDQQCQWTE